jgi:hypothetical protein
MKPVVKVAVSLLITVIIFSAFVIFAFSGLFSFVETRFYNQRIKNEISSEVEDASAAIEEYNRHNRELFRSFISADYVKRSFLPNQSQEDIFQRRTAYNNLKTEFPGLLFVRLVDTKGNIHYSTYDADMKREDDFSVVYNRLKDVDTSLPEEDLLLSEGESGDFIIDAENNRLIYQFPFYDHVDIFKGTALFYVSKRDLKNDLIKQNVLEEGRDFSLVDRRGYLFNIDVDENSEIKEELDTVWQSESEYSSIQTEPILAAEGENRFFLFSTWEEDVGYLGYLVPESFFSLNQYLKNILMVSFFLTVFLVLFLLLSIKQDKVLVLSERIKRFQINFLKEYVENRESVDWNKWQREVGRKKHAVASEIKQGLGKLTQEREKEVDELIDKSWDEILSIIGERIEEPRKEPVTVSNKIEIENLEQVLERILQKGNIAIPVTQAPGTEGAGTARPAEREARRQTEPPEEQPQEQPQEQQAEEEPVSDLEEVTPVKYKPGEPIEVEEISEEEYLAEEAGEEDLEEVELEEIGTVPEEKAETAEAVEEIEEIEEVEELEEAEEISGEAEPEETEEELPLEEVIPVEDVIAAAEIETEAEEEAKTEEMPGGEEPGGAEPSGEAYLEEPQELEEVEEELPEAVPEPEPEEPEKPLPEQVEDLPPEQPEEYPEPEPEPSQEEEQPIEEIEEEEKVPEVPEAEPEPEEEEVEEVEEISESGAGLEEAEPVEEREEEAEELTALLPEEESGSVPAIEEPEGEGVLEEIQAAEEAEEAALLEEEAEEEDQYAVLEEVKELPFRPFEREQQEQLAELETIEERSEEAAEPLEMVSGGYISGGNVSEGYNYSSIFAGYKPGAFNQSFNWKASFVDEEASTMEDYSEAGGAGETAADEPEELQPEELEAEEGVPEPPEIEEAVPEPLEPEEAPSGEEGVESAETAPPENKYDAQLKKIIGTLLKNKKIEIVDLSHILDKYSGKAEAIESDADGVPMIREDVLESRRDKGDEEFQALVTDVSKSSVPEQEERMLSIGDLFESDEVDLSLSIFSDEQKEGAERDKGYAEDQGVAAERSTEENVCFTTEGFNFDLFSESFSPHQMRVMKSLLTISRETKAIFAALLVERDGSLTLDNSVGFDEISIHSLTFNKEEPFYKDYLQKQKCIALKMAASVFQPLASKISQMDQKYLQGSVFFPVKAHHTRGYLFLGLKISEISVEEVAEKLNFLCNDQL